MRYDYVIAGGGSAGCALAARLSEDPSKTVCLIEAGGEGRDMLIRAPAGIIGMLSGRPRINNWAFETVPQQGLGGRNGYQPRGKALGGSSAINAMLYVRGHRSDYDEWADLGCEGWSWDEVLPYFRRAEGNERGTDALHGGDGPLKVSNQRSPRPIAKAFIEACAENQIRASDDFNGPEQEGAGYFQVTQFAGGARNGERCSTAAAYLHPVMQRTNLTVITRAHATRIVLDGKRATGIRYRTRKGEAVAQASCEVILCGGAFGSPQLLLLSGIGPAAELAVHGVPVVHELPGVGKNLQDHLDFIVGWRSKDTDMLGMSPRGALGFLRHIAQWRRDGTGLIASPAAESGAFVKSDPALERPDLQLQFVIGLVENHARTLHYGFGFSCHVCILRPALAWRGWAGQRRSTCRAAHRSALSRRPARYGAAVERREDHPAGAGFTGADALPAQGNAHRRRAERCRSDDPYPYPRRHGLSPGRLLSDGRRRDGGGRSATQGARA